jgi:hypothetical protein
LMKAIADHIRYPLFMNKSSPRSSVTLDPALPEFPDFPEPFDADFVFRYVRIGLS